MRTTSLINNHRLEFVERMITAFRSNDINKLRVRTPYLLSFFFIFRRFGWRHLFLIIHSTGLQSILEFMYTAYVS